MKKYICYRIEYAYQFYISSIEGSDISDMSVTFKAGNDWQILKIKDNGALTETLSKAQDFDRVIQKLALRASLEGIDRNKFTKAPVIFRLSLSDGRTMVWGSLDNACSLSSMENDLGNFKAEFTRNSDCYQF